MENDKKQSALKLAGELKEALENNLFYTAWACAIQLRALCDELAEGVTK